MNASDPEQWRTRYARQIMLPGVGETGQRKLGDASVLVVGAGGLGSPALIYLAAGGVGCLGIADGDTVEETNLHRQIIHPHVDVGEQKVMSAAKTLAGINPSCRVVTFAERLVPERMEEVTQGFSVVLDCTDNFPARFMVTDHCWRAGIPVVSAAVLHFEGQLMTILPGPGNPCYRCHLPEDPPPEILPTPEDSGILGTVAGVMGVLQATEAIKLILGIGEVMSHRLLVYDGLGADFMSFERKQNPQCPLCGSGQA